MPIATPRMLYVMKRDNPAVARPCGCRGAASYLRSRGRVTCPCNGFVAWRTCRRSHPFHRGRSVPGAFDLSGADGPAFSRPSTAGRAPVPRPRRGRPRPRSGRHPTRAASPGGTRARGRGRVTPERVARPHGRDRGGRFRTRSAWTGSVRGFEASPPSWRDRAAAARLASRQTTRPAPRPVSALPRSVYRQASSRVVRSSRGQRYPRRQHPGEIGPVPAWNDGPRTRNSMCVSPVSMRATPIPPPTNGLNGPIRGTPNPGRSR